jgi:hypothetical protein
MNIWPILEQNHRSTGVKPVGASKKRGCVSGAKPSLHRRKAGGGVNEYMANSGAKPSLHRRKAGGGVNE